MQTGIEVHDLSASYGTGPDVVPVFRGLGFKVRLGEIGLVIGPSGAGKTTLLNCVAGLHPYDRGSVVLAADHPNGAVQHTGDRRLTPRERRRIGIAYQQPNLWSHLCVRDNLVHPQVWLKRCPRAQARRRADELLEALELSEYGPAQVSDLSGGQRQRVAILRALALEPDVLLLDEVTASQDPINVQRIFELVRAYVRRSRCTVLTISHDMEFVRRIADQVFFLRDGVIRGGGSVEALWSAGGDEEIASFINGFAET